MPEKIVQQMLIAIGEDPEREGLVKTPHRVVRAWKELFGGYTQSPEQVLVTDFDSDGYQGMVLLKDIEFFSTCEHHLLSFGGRGHIAYIPNKRVVGISKLARVLDIYARRLQIQERIGEQVVDAIMNYVKPIGAACILEAKHLCMQCRGVEKQHSIMVTSSLRGVFMKKTLEGQTARAELMSLIRG